MKFNMVLLLLPMAISWASLAYSNFPGGRVVSGVRKVVFSDDRMVGPFPGRFGRTTRWSLSQSGMPAFVAASGTLWRESANGDLEFEFFPSTILAYDVNKLQATGSGGVVFGGTQAIGSWPEASGSSIELIVQTGQQIVGSDGRPIPGTSWSLLNLHAVNDVGDLLFSGRFESQGQPGFEEGLWKYDETNGLRLILVKGDEAPDASPNTIQRVQSLDNIFQSYINGSGRISFSAELEGPDIDNDFDASLYSDRDGTLKRIAYDLGQARGFSPGAQIRSLSHALKQNDAGEMIFNAVIANSPVNEENGFLMLVDSPNETSLRIVAKDGGPAPGTSSAFDRFTLTGDELAINGEGQAVFKGRVSSGSRWGFWAENAAKELELVSIDDAPVPGFADLFMDGHRDTGFQVNALGQMAFSLRLTGTQVTQDSDQAFFVRGSNGDVRLFAREGDSIEVTPGDFRHIRTVGILNTNTGNQDGLEINLNDRGQFLFKALFMDGTEGLFFTTISDPLTGDFDQDGDVDGFDLLKWQRGESPDPLSHSDLADWQAIYGNAANPITAASTAVPEPNTKTILIVLTTMGVLLRQPSFRPRSSC